MMPETNTNEFQEPIVTEELDNLEPEGEPEEEQTDVVLVRDGRGRVIRMEVPDDE